MRGGNVEITFKINDVIHYTIIIRTVIDKSLDPKSRLIQNVLDYAQHNDSYCWESGCAGTIAK